MLSIIHQYKIQLSKILLAISLIIIFVLLAQHQNKCPNIVKTWIIINIVLFLLNALLFVLVNNNLSIIGQIITLFATIMLLLVSIPCKQHNRTLTIINIIITLTGLVILFF